MLNCSLNCSSSAFAALAPIVTGLFSISCILCFIPSSLVKRLVISLIASAGNISIPAAAWLVCPCIFIKLSSKLLIFCTSCWYLCKLEVSITGICTSGCQSKDWAAWTGFAAVVSTSGSIYWLKSCIAGTARSIWLIISIRTIAILPCNSMPVCMHDITTTFLSLPSSPCLLPFYLLQHANQ